MENHAKGAQNVRVISTILDPSGKEVGKAASQPAAISEWGERTYEQQVAVKQPALWSLEERNLYKLVTEVESGGTVTDRYETRFGIRDLKFDAEKGFFLNGKPVKVKGTCNHQDHAGVGVALPDAVQHFRVRKLQEMGCNAIRTSHNPPTPELLDACDELGMLVLDETRMLSSNPEGLAQFENMVRRDRNHPSVFIWSMGNEESISPTETGLRLLTSMKRAAPEARRFAADQHRAAARGRLHGQRRARRLRRHGLQLRRPAGRGVAQGQSHGSHSGHGKCQRRGHTRRLRDGSRQGNRQFLRPVHHHRPRFGRRLVAVRQRAGRISPAVSCGPASIIAANRRRTSGRTSVRSTASSTPAGSRRTRSTTTSRGGPTSRCCTCSRTGTGPASKGRRSRSGFTPIMDRVELFHNGQSLGAKDMQKDQHLAWIVKYAPGTIEARGYKDGKQVMTAKRETTGPAAKLVLRPDRQEISADGEDVAICTVEVQDAQGRVLPITDNQVTFKVTGPGEVIGTGNGDPTNHEPDGGPARKAFAGLCMAIVQSTKTAGSLRVEATSPGLTAATATITSKAVKLRPQVAVWERQVPTGTGVTGLWRPAAAVAAAATEQSDGPRRRQRRHGLHAAPGRQRAHGLGGIRGRRRLRRRRRQRAARSRTERSMAPMSRSVWGRRPTRAR